MLRCIYCCSLKAAARDYQKELNYQEAFKESYVAYASPSLPSDVETLLTTAEVRGRLKMFLVCRVCAHNTVTYIGWAGSFVFWLAEVPGKMEK